MVLRCSLLGHDYGEPDVEREREERGSEVVVTVQEYEQCERCGEKHVISENTEVTSLDAADDAADPGLDADPDPAAASDADEAEPDAVETDHPAVDEDDGVPTDEDGEPVTDDAEILDDEAPAADEREREHGEWPDSDDVGPPAGTGAEPAAWPETDDDSAGSDDGADAAPDDDAAFVDADPESGSTHPASEPDADRAVAGAEAGGGTGIESARSAPAPGEGASPEGVPTEFFCPRCDFVAPGDRGSLRAGDICPDCRKGYLSERER